MDLLGIGKAAMGMVDTVADKFFVDAKDKEAFKLTALKLQQDGTFREQENQLSAIVAEAKSSDPWTSRARPAFLWVIYIMILFAIPMGILSAFKPLIATQVAAGMQAWLEAIPEALWALFGAGYLGYVGSRSYDKTKSIGSKK